MIYNYIKKSNTDKSRKTEAEIGRKVEATDMMTQIRQNVTKNDNKIELARFSIEEEMLSKRNDK